MTPRFLFIAALIVTFEGSIALTRISSATSADVQLLSVMDWHGCTKQGSCMPAFYPVPDGHARLLRCDQTGHCALFTYVYWSPENCNRLTACPDYPPHRGDRHDR